MTPTPKLPPGSLILVTGANGLIAGHVINQLLKLRYKVRGTVRSLPKSSWLTSSLYAAEAASGFFELAEVPDMAEPHAYRSALHGVAGVIHIATIASWDPNPHNVVPQTVAGAVNILEDAAAEPSVKAFVYTSSVVAAALPMPGTKWHIGADSWNDTALELAWAPPPYNPERALPTYMASKVEAERAVWKFVEEQKPGFMVNAVLPFTVFGPLLHEKQNPSTVGWALALFHGDTTYTSVLNSSVYVHVEDVALLHVAALLDPSVENARLHAWSDGFIWNDVLAIFKKLYPKKEFVDLKDEVRLTGTVDDQQSKDLLKTWGGRDGFLGLEAGIKDSLEGAQPVK